jgi:site-specific recombinase XerD
MSYAGESAGVTGTKTPRLLDQVRARLRVKHYSLRTEQAYVGWIRRFILANDKRHPRDMGVSEVEGFLSTLATQGQVAAGTQNQALSALLFLYREVLSIELPWMETIVRAKRPQRVPVVLSRDEVIRLLALMDDQFGVRLSYLHRRNSNWPRCANT